MKPLSLKPFRVSIPLLAATVMTLLGIAVAPATASARAATPQSTATQIATASAGPPVKVATDDAYPDWCDDAGWTETVDDDCDYVEDPPPVTPPPADPGDGTTEDPGDGWDPGWAPPDDPRWPKTPNGAVAKLASDGRTAIAPKRAPRIVKDMIHAANRITRKPYKWGGGHARLTDTGYDCSGATSYVLRSVGLVNGSMVSGGYKAWGVKGAGRWVNVYANNGHVFMVVAGLRFDTSGQGESGPRWRTEARFVKGFKLRHPRHL